MQSYVEAWKFFSPEEKEHERNREKKSFLFLNREIILVAAEQRWEVRTSFDNYKISSLWLDVIDDYTVANSRPASLHLWDISFLHRFQAVKASPARGTAREISEPDINAFGGLHYVG